MSGISSVEQSVAVTLYSEKSDEELVLLAKVGDVTATEMLVNRYRNFAKTCSKSYFLVGADREDVVQEGMIGLYKAIVSFQADKEVSFKTFAMLCIKRQIISAVKMSTRQKHQPLNAYVSLNDEGGTGDSGCLSVSGADPEKLVIEVETVAVTHKQIDELLSPFEAEVLMYHLNGVSYGKIAERLGREPKAVDNALQRIKHKVLKFL